MTTFDVRVQSGSEKCTVSLAGSGLRLVTILLSAQREVVKGGRLRIAALPATKPRVYAIRLKCTRGRAIITRVRVVSRRRAVAGSAGLRASFAPRVRPYRPDELQGLAHREWSRVGSEILKAFRGSGQCTDWASQKRPDIIQRVSEATFIADRLGRGFPTLGDARTWARVAAEAGMTVTNRPVSGALVVWQPGAEGAQTGTGHVGYVESVAADGATFSTSEMNFGLSPHTMGYRTLSSEPIDGRLFIEP